MSQRFVIMAGGTGGHIFPALAIATALKNQGHTVTWLGSSKRMETRLVPEAGFELDTLTIQGLRGNGVLGYAVLPWRLTRAVWQARIILKKRRPDWVIGMGGFAAGPGGMAAKWLGMPLAIHEQNSRAGWTNRLLAHWAKHVFCAYPNAFPGNIKAHCIGNPLRQALIDQAQSVKKTTRKQLRVLVVGGSLGAWAINKVMAEAIALYQHPAQILNHVQDDMNTHIIPDTDPESLSNHDLENLNHIQSDKTVSSRPPSRDLDDIAPITIRHQSGETTYQQTVDLYKQHQVKANITPFIDDMAAAYQWADIVICRAGALTISEVTLMGKPAIFIPLPHAVDNHQYHNAMWLVEHNAALLIEQKELTPERLAKQISQLTDPATRLTMAQHAQRLAKPDSTQRLLKALG